MTVPPPKGADSGRKTLTYRGGSGWASVRGGGSGAGRGPHFTIVLVRLIVRLRGFLTMATLLNDPTGQGGSSGQRGSGSSGQAGDSGSAGEAGDSGSAGQAGDSGSAGQAGDSGSAGQAGTP